MDRLIDPVIADMQCEHAQAGRDDRPWHRRRIVLNGYVAFWKAVALHVPIATWRIVHRWVASIGTVGGALGAALGTMIALTALLIAVPWLSFVPAGHNGEMAWLLLLLVPQTIPLTLPVVLLVGVLCGLRRRMVTAPIRRAILGIGLAGSLASFGSINWLIPASNQAFRVTVAGRHIERGPAEMPLRSLREQALLVKNEGGLREAGSLFLHYHVRGALVGAAVAFALFGLGVTALRVGPAATAGIAIVVCVLYSHYVFELGNASHSAFSDERLALGVAWLPNVLLILTTVAVFAARGTRPPDHRLQE